MSRVGGKGTEQSLTTQWGAGSLSTTATHSVTLLAATKHHHIPAELSGRGTAAAALPRGTFSRENTHSVLCSEQHNCVSSVFQTDAREWKETKWCEDCQVAVRAGRMWTAVGGAQTKVQKQLIDVHPGVPKAATLHRKRRYIERPLKGTADS